MGLTCMYELVRENSIKNCTRAAGLGWPTGYARHYARVFTGSSCMHMAIARSAKHGNGMHSVCDGVATLSMIIQPGMTP